MGEPYLWRTANMSRRTCVVVKQMQSKSNPITCHHCGQSLTIVHMLLECAALQEIRDKYYTADSLKTLCKKIPETCIVGVLREAGLLYLIWIFNGYKL